MLTAEQRRDYIQTIADLPDELDRLVAPLSHQELTTQYIPDEWTVAQIVHHLVDMHTNSYLRLKAILTSDRPEMQILDQENLAVWPDAKDGDIQYSMMILRGLHHRWVQTWNAMTDEQWQRIGLIRGTKEITPDYLVEGYANHCINHLNQIREVLDMKRHIEGR
ncbi:MAG: DinB family protein [Chloroflexota bacterium]